MGRLRAFAWFRIPPVLVRVGREFTHVAARACRGREVARIDREAAPNVRRVLDVFFAEQLLTVVARPAVRVPAAPLR
jgi:hypothetical protein